jgi:predicted HTH domain antitoxin
MGQVNVALPADLVSVAGFDQGNVSLEAAKLIALELFREDRISLGRAAELCGLPLEAFMQFASEHNAPLHYSIEDLEEDRRTMDRLGL